MNKKIFINQPKFWFNKNIISIFLLPFSWLFQLIVKFRHFLYQKNIFKVTHFKVPVIVIGNVAVGGTGKTPLVIWLAEFLNQNGFKPGIVTRGFRDEALLITRHLQNLHIPIMTNKNRVLAVENLLKVHSDCNVIISDDGLQHYALGRNIEIVVIDGRRGFGNGFCLPAGSMREAKSRLNLVNFIVVNENETIIDLPQTVPVFEMHFDPVEFINVKEQNKCLTINDKFFNDKKLHAVAGIGNPKRFFDTLTKLNLNFIAHEFPDHYLYKPEDLNFGKDVIILMTEKDAVKCESAQFANENYWFLKIKVHIDDEFGKEILQKIN